MWGGANESLVCPRSSLRETQRHTGTPTESKSGGAPGRLRVGLSASLSRSRGTTPCMSSPRLLSLRDSSPSLLPRSRSRALHSTGPRSSPRLAEILGYRNCLHSPCASRHVLSPARGEWSLFHWTPARVYCQTKSACPWFLWSDYPSEETGSNDWTWPLPPQSRDRKEGVVGPLSRRGGVPRPVSGPAGRGRTNSLISHVHYA